MTKRIHRNPARMALMAFSSVTLLATVGACGRASTSTEQQLMDLAAKTGTRLNTLSDGLANSQEDRTPEDTERLLRGLIDKERAEREAVDAMLSKRVDALETDLRAFKEQVNARFAEVDKRDGVLRAEMQTSLQELRNADKELADKLSVEAKARIAELDKVRNQQASLESLVTSRVDALEKDLQKKLDDQKISLQSAKDLMKSELEAKASELNARMRDAETSAREGLQKQKEEIISRISLIEKAAQAESVRLDKTLADLSATKKALESEAETLGEALSRAKNELMRKVDSLNITERIELETNVKLLSNKLANMNDQLERESAALASKQIENDRRIASLDARLAAETKARQQAISALEAETELLIKQTDAKTQGELRSLIAQVDQRENLEALQKKMLEKLENQDAKMRLSVIDLTTKLATLAEESKKSAATLELQMRTSIDNVRGEMVSRISDLNSVVSAARSELGEKIAKGLSGLSASFSEKLLATENHLNDRLRQEVSAQRIEIESLKMGLAAADNKFEAKMKEQNDDLKSKMDALKARLDSSMQDLLAAHQAETLRNQETAVALSKLIAEQQAALLSSQLNYESQLQALNDQQIIANANQDAAAAAERQVLINSLQAEREARNAELSKLSGDLNLLRSAQEQARAKLEEDIRNKVELLSGKSAEERRALEAQIMGLNDALVKIDENTFATVKLMKDSLVQERRKTEEQIVGAVSSIESKLAQAALDTQKVAARVEAVSRAHEQFEAFVAKNYATKGELEALNLRIEGLEFVTKVMNSDMTRARAELKELVSKEVANVREDLSKKIESVDGSVEGIRNQLGGAISSYQMHIANLSSKMSAEITKIKSEMKNQDSALFAALSDQKSLQEKVNADIMLSLKRNAVDLESMSQNVKRELSDKLVYLEGSLDKTNQALDAERKIVQARFAEVVKQEQALKDSLTKELSSLKDEIKQVAKVANQSLKLGQANTEQINLVKADLTRQGVTLNGVAAQLNAHEIYAAKQFKLQGEQIGRLNESVDRMKEDFNKRIAEVGAQAEELVQNLGQDVRSNFKKIATELARQRSIQKATEAKLITHYLNSFKLDWDSDIEEFSLLVADDQSLLLSRKEIRNGKPVVVGKGPLINTLESFAEVRRAFLAALQPKQRSENGERVEFYDRSFVPIMTQCGGNAEATFANALGRDSFDFLADEFIAGLIVGARGSASDALYLKNGPLTDGDSLHHYVMLEALRNLEGGSNNPTCMSQIRAWANGVLSSNQFRSHRERIASNTQFQARVAEFVKAVGEMKSGTEKLERRIANRVLRGQLKIALAISRIPNPVAIFGQAKSEEVAADLLSNLAHTLSEAADATYDAIARQEEFDKLVQVQKQFARAMKDESPNNVALNAMAEQRERALNSKIASLENKISAFDKAAKDVDSLKGRVENMNASLSRALDVVMSLAIRAGHPDLVAATREAGQIIGYSPREIAVIKPKILEVQHFFASPALANSSDTCTGNSIRRGAGVKFWTQGGQCWVNFRNVSLNRWASMSQGIWFRVFGAADRLQVRSRHCGSNGAPSCNATFRFRNGSAKVMSGSSNVTANLQGQPHEGVFDIRMPQILSPYIERSRSWDGEKINFLALGSEGQGSVNAEYTVQLYSPIVLDFMTIGRPQFSSVESSKARFDLNGDGLAERTGWISGHRDVGLLALDINGNGTIDSGRELFGEATILKNNGKKAKDGYTALAQYDSNKDGVIDNNDAIFSKLVVWFDRNQDGKTNSGELVSLSQSQVSRIALGYKRLTDGERFENGNEMRTTAKFWGPKQCGTAGCNSYDVYFSTAFMLTQKK